MVGQPVGPLAGRLSPGVLIVNLGPPDAPTHWAVRRYLREFLWDPRVVHIPRLPWWLLLNFLILPLRPFKTARKYASIGREDGSPLRVYLGRQVEMLRGFLGERAKKAIRVAGAMRYGNPSIWAGLAELRSRGCDRIVVLPLYPQYAGSTTASTEDAVAKALRKWRPAPALKVVRDFHDHPAYVKAIAKSVNDYWMKSGRPDRLVMSFHSCPPAMVEAGYPHEKQCL